MKVTEKHPKQQAENIKPFPKLMISIYTDNVILATSQDGDYIIGTCLIHTHSSSKVGQHVKWIAQNFKDLPTGYTIELEQE